jgi:hypothetical protein
MGKPERDLINDYLSNLPENVRMFRTNSGMAWAGKSTLKGEFRIIKNARPFHGLPEGFPDLCGWTEIEITPDMIGQKIAVFTTVEVKATGKIKPESKQGKFRDLILRMGGLHRELKPD